MQTAQAGLDWEIGQSIQAYWHEGAHGAGHYPCKIVELRSNEAAVQWADGSGINTIPFTGLKRRRGRPTSSRVTSVIKMPFGHTQQAVCRLARQQTAAPPNPFSMMTARINSLEAAVQWLKAEVAQMQSDIVAPFRDVQRVVAQLKDWQLVQSRIASR